MSAIDRRDRSGAIVDLNLLPRDQRPREVSAWAVAAVAVFVLLLVALVPFGIRAQRAQRSADHATREASRAEASLHDLQLDVATQRAQRVELSDLMTKIDALKDQRALIQGGVRPLDDDLARLWAPGLLPPGARLTTIAGTDAGFKVEGVAAGPLDAIAYADRLVSVESFASARMTSFAPDARHGGAFTLEVER
jgi:hypothetical protein